MAKSKTSRGAKSRESTQVHTSVEDFVAGFDSPLKPLVLALRQTILRADPTIAEGIKWNVPSFRTTDYFATLHLRASTGVGVVLHLGAKKRAAESAMGEAVADPQSLLKWLAPDRAMAHFNDLQDLNAKQAAFVELIRQWILHV